MRAAHLLMSLVVTSCLALAVAGCGEESTDDNEDDPVTCQDGLDNDHDGFEDCFDPDCMPLSVCAPTDGDGDADGDADTDGDGDGDGDGDADGACPDGCDDGVDCTEDECVAGECAHTPDDGACDDSDDCTSDVCDPIEGCEHIGRDEDDDGHVAEECGGDDCDDSDSTVHPGALETVEELLCDGVDQDCDGVADDGVCCVGLVDDVRLTDAEGRSAGPNAAHTGTGHGVCWQDDRGGVDAIYLVLTDEDLARTGGDLLVSDGATAAAAPTIAYSAASSLFAVAWTATRSGADGADVYVRLIGADGTPSGASVRVTDTAVDTTALDVEWNGTDFAVLYHEPAASPAATLRIARVGTDGSIVAAGADVVTSGEPGTDGDLVWAATEYAVVWTDWTGGVAAVMAATVAADLASGSAPLAVSSSTSSARDVAADWSGAEVVVSWTDRRDGSGEIYANAFASGSLACATDVRLSSGTGPSSVSTIIAGAGAHTVVWRVVRASRVALLSVAVDTTSCTLATAETEVTWGDPLDPIVVAGAMGPAVFWSDGRITPRFEIFANRIGCAPTVP